MRIRVTIEGTAPNVPEGTYAYLTGALGNCDLNEELKDLESWVLRSLRELRKLQVVG